MEVTLIWSAFIAGLLTFFAPCTLPLIPGYLAFISGSQGDLNDPKNLKIARRSIMVNAVYFVIGFSTVFIMLGILASMLSQVFGPYFRLWLTRVGGVVVIVFGLFMLDVFKLPFLNKNYKFNPPKFLEVGRGSSSFLVGAAFGFGWTPCIGPILGAILILATTTSTIFEGALLLLIFSLGLAVPFLIVAFGIGSAFKYISAINKYSGYITKVGGVFLIILGVLLLTNNLGILLRYGYDTFNILNYEAIMDYM